MTTRLSSNRGETYGNYNEAYEIIGTHATKIITIHYTFPREGILFCTFLILNGNDVKYVRLYSMKCNNLLIVLFPRW